MAKTFILCAILVGLAVVAECQFNFGQYGGAPAQRYPQQQGGRAPEVIDSVTGLVTGIIGTTFGGIASLPRKNQWNPPNNGGWGQQNGNGGGWGQQNRW